MAVAVDYTARATSRRHLGVNQLVGIRTPATMRSPASWFAGHDAAQPWMRASVWIRAEHGAELTLLLLVLIWAMGRDSRSIEAAITVLGLGVVLLAAAVLLWGTLSAHRAARAVEQ